MTSKHYFINQFAKKGNKIKINLDKNIKVHKMLLIKLFREVAVL
jgi:hypothetical protein